MAGETVFSQIDESEWLAHRVRTWLVIWLVFGSGLFAGCATSSGSDRMSKYHVHDARKVVEHSARSAHEAASLVGYSVTPIQQFDIHKHLICLVQAGDAYCADVLDADVRFRRVASDVKRVSVMGFSPRPCWTRTDDTVWCGERETSIKDPLANLVAGEDSVCSFQGRMIQCHTFPAFSSHRGGNHTVSLPEGYAEVVGLSVFDSFGKTTLAATDADGRVLVWWDLRASKQPKPYTIEAVKQFELTQHGMAAVTMTNEVLIDERLVGTDRGRTRLCGIDDALDLEVAHPDVMIRTERGMVFVSRSARSLAPIHEPCHGPAATWQDVDVDDYDLGSRSAACVVIQNQPRCYGQITGTKGLGSAPPRHMATIHTDAVTIASGNEFNCALLSDGEVRCAGPSMGRFGETEAVPGARNAMHIYADRRVLCAEFESSLKCWWRGTTKENPRSQWFEIRPLKLRHRPENLKVSESGVTWTHEDRQYRYTLSLPFADRASPWSLEPGKRTEQFTRTSPRKVKTNDAIKAVSGSYFILEDGKLYKHSQQALDVPSLVFGILTGGILLPVFMAASPSKTTELGTFPETVALASGVHHLCHLAANGAVKCSGGPPHGEPREVNFGGKAKEITAGTFHTCALLESGDVNCLGQWGFRLIRPPELYPEWQTVPFERDQHPAGF